jgi:hypothetical protein
MAIYAVAHSLSKSHLLSAMLGQVLQRGAAFEIDLEIHGGEVGRRAASNKRRLLPRKIGAVLGAIGRRADIDDDRVFIAGVLVADGVADVGMPPGRVARPTSGIETMPAISSMFHSGLR